MENLDLVRAFAVERGFMMDYIAVNRSLKGRFFVKSVLKGNVSGNWKLHQVNKNYIRGWFKQIRMQNILINLKIDTGSDVNIINVKDFAKLTNVKVDNRCTCKI